MKKLFVLLSLFLLVKASVGSAQENTAKWADAPVEMSNYSSTGHLSLRYYHSDSEIKYEFKNDQERLYLIFACANKSLQQQIEMAGLSLRFKVNTKPKTDASLRLLPKTFPEYMTAPASQKGKAMSMTTPRNNQIQIQSDLLKRPVMVDTAHISGFRQSKDIVLSNKNNPDDICFFKSKKRDENFILIFSIPLRDLFGEEYSLAEIKQIPINVQMNINAFSQNNSFSGASGRPDGIGGELGGMGGRSGGMGGGPGGMTGGHGGMGGGPGGMRSKSDGMEERLQGGASASKKTIKFDIFLFSPEK